ncbi:nitroreductase family deazaflavin-dependent oxidoreductase [Amycolatopsis sp. NPDC089917]|uniref:nitroreductase family deazaflavin-dependent oxidoreductase n=1 Tax=Amycolatopsis sp. NPDC089917 TaxID=3155187 RepID=UPI00344055DA
MDFRSVNAAMVDKLRAEAGEPLLEGGYALRVVETRGRVSGRPRLVPLAVVQRDGDWFLIAPQRDRDWVRNLSEEPACVLLDGERRFERQARPVAGAEAAAVVRQYLRAMSAPWAVSAFPVAQDASLEEITGALPKMAVFSLGERE